MASEPAEPARPAPWSREFDVGNFLIPLIWAAWLLAALTLMAAVTFQSIAFSRRLRSARQHTPAPLHDLLAECRRIMGIRREVVLLETEAVTSPVLYGLFRHRILLPWGFADRFSAVELRHVLLHELAHVQRGDLWLNWLVTALQIVHWFNPLVWLGFARLRADRELACDELAMLRSGADTGRDYGRTMLKLLEDFARPKAMPGLVGILEDKQQMRRRVRMIARFKRPSRWSALALIPIAALGLVLLTDAQVREATSTEAIPADSDTAADTVLRILDDETGNPIAGAVINANHLQLVSDTAGVARIPMTEQTKSTRGMNIFITPVGYVPKVITWPWREEFFREYSVRLQPARTIGGIVVDEAGQPVPGVRINLPSPDISGQAGIEHIAYHPEQTAAYTDMAGRWEWPYLPRDATNFRFTLTATNYMATEIYAEVIDDLSRKHGIHGMQTIHLTNSLGLTDLKATIYRGFSLTGRVLGRGADRELHPVAGALVREVHNHGYGHYRVQAITDDRGEFAMQGLRFQPTTLVAETGGFSPASAEIELHVGPNKHTFLLSKGPALKGRVLDASGLAITNALIRTDTGSQGTRLFNWTTRSDAEGRFEWPHAPRGEVLYWFEADGFLPVRDRPLTADGTEHQIILEPRDPPPSASVPKPIFEMRLVESYASGDTEALRNPVKTTKPLPESLQNLFVRKEPLLDVSALFSAQAGTDQFTGRPVINLEFTAEGQARFAEVTQGNVGRQLAIVVDGQVLSAPHINEPITVGKAVISGSFTREEAERLARFIQQNIARNSAGSTPFTGAIQGRVFLGRVILEGKPPPEMENAVMDEHSRAQHTNAPTTQFSVVADDDGLKDVVVYLEGDLPPLAAGTDLPPLIIDHQSGFKVPYVSALAVGQTLLLTNSDAQLHNCHIIPPQGSTNREVNKTMKHGVASSHTFTAPDQWVRLKCDVQPWEFAYVCVFPHRYFAVTDATGRFSITNVPPGRYQLHTLHRKAKGLEPNLGSSSVFGSCAAIGLSSRSKPLRDRRRDHAALHHHQHLG